ncbi:MAG TPA: hypothetical protein PK322_03990 [Opitutaceae bacterium]|nr:hypothetical protein [Opitutaceae bacterium]
MIPTAQIHQASALRYRLETLRNGEVVSALPWVDHMITDAGLEALAANFGPNMIVAPILGDAASPTPVRRDGGSILFSQNSDVVSTDGAVAFFVAADVGRLLKFGAGTDGAECYVAEFISASSVRVDRSATVTSQPAVVWYVNTAAILSPIAGLTWSVVSGSAYNYTQGTVSGDVVTITHQTTRLSSAFAAAKTITEIAFTANGANTNVFDRDTIQPGAGVLIGDQARVTVQLIYTVSGVTPVSVPDFGTGANTAGQSALVSVGLDTWFGGFAGFMADGSVNNSMASLDPVNAAQAKIILLTADFVMPGFSMTSTINLAGVDKVAVASGYVSGSRVRDYVANFATSEGNGTIYGFSFGIRDGDYFIHKLTTPFTKTNSQTLSVTFRKSFRRLLNN